MTIEFTAWPKIARLNRDMIITEKIDGTNAAVGFKAVDTVDAADPNIIAWIDDPEYGFAIGAYAQSRKQLITPEKDNAGFARWVQRNAQALYSTLGYGLHFGEWWGSGIQRGYGLQNGEKRFSLFNTPRYGNPEKFDLTPLKEIGVDTVPVLWEGPFTNYMVNLTLSDLNHSGSKAAPGFMKPEGIIVFHVAAQMPFKVTIEKDDEWKGKNDG